MLELESDDRPFETIWADYLGDMARDAWAEINEVPMRPDIAGFSRLVASGYAGVWPVKSGQEIAGHVLWMINEDLFVTEFVFSVVSLYLKREYRNAVNLKNLMRLLRARIKKETGVKRYTVQSNKYLTHGDRIWIGEV